MMVVVYAQDLSGRRDDGYYTKPDIAAALEIFFTPPDAGNFLDVEAEIPLTREEAREIFEIDGRVAFYNEDGEKVVISRDISKAA
jgi:hypothetical protein